MKIVNNGLTTVVDGALGHFPKEFVVSALKKQIPKKPNIHGYREGREVNTISYTCPICNKHIGRDAYCKHCGQKLDWSDTE
jgi:hypothetical protein